jgi:hypothetical protein
MMKVNKYMNNNFRMIMIVINQYKKKIIELICSKFYKIILKLIILFNKCFFYYI